MSLLFSSARVAQPRTFGRGILASCPVYHEAHIERMDALYADELARDCERAGLGLKADDMDDMCCPCWDEQEQDAAYAEMIEGHDAEPIGSIHMLHADGMLFAVMLDDQPIADVDALDARVQQVKADHGDLPGVAWIARTVDGRLVMLDREDGRVYGTTPIRAETLESAMGRKLPA